VYFSPPIPASRAIKQKHDAAGTVLVKSEAPVFRLNYTAGSPVGGLPKKKKRKVKKVGSIGV
jgi:hypothetical protein